MDETLKLKSGLYVTATPIGNLGDMTSRAIATLKSGDLILLEDRSVTAKLLRRFEIKTPTQIYHEHTTDTVRHGILKKLLKGMRIALVSDAGTPLISDPGYKLVRETRSEKIPVYTIPGPSSVTAALSVSGMPTDRFYFSGFLPSKRRSRRKALEALKTQNSTLLFLESPNRLMATLEDMVEIFGGERPGTICRELTKLYEETQTGSLITLKDSYATREKIRGEIVILVGASSKSETDPEDLDGLLLAVGSRLSSKETANVAAEVTGVSRKTAYDRWLQLKEKR